MRRQWEYHFYQPHDGENEAEAFNRLGREGWQFKSFLVTASKGGESWPWQAVFERPMLGSDLL